MTPEEVLQLLQKTGALLEGHFILRSGRRSRQFVQCARALERMPDVRRLGQALAERVRDLNAATVLAPAMGGLVIGQEIARQLGLRYLFAEKAADGSLRLRRGFALTPGERTLIVEDVVTRGGRVKETIAIAEAAEGTVAGVAALVDRSETELSFGCPFYSLIRLNIETHDPENLPPDLLAVPAVKPGS